MTDAEHTATMPPTAEEAPSNLRLVLAMTMIGLMAAVMIVAVYQLTFPVIERNKAIALERAIFEVVPGASTKTAWKRDGNTLTPLADGEDAIEVYYTCYDESGALVGVALEASGQGFQDILRIIYGYSPACRCVVGMKVLESKETPGLGDKIEKDPRFLENFEALDVQLGDDGVTMRNPVVMVKKGEKTDPWQVEAITGATISSRAIATILRESTAEAVPVISANMNQLQEAGQ